MTARKDEKGVASRLLIIAFARNARTVALSSGSTSRRDGSLLKPVESLWTLWITWKRSSGSWLSVRAVVADGWRVPRIGRSLRARFHPSTPKPWW